MNEPIQKFRDEAHAWGCLVEWQNRLFLNDWLIKIKLKPLCELSDAGHVGENDYRIVTKTSLISIGKPGTGTELWKNPQELTLVHELLHLKFAFSDGAKETAEGVFFGLQEHVLIEQMAKSLIMAKYDLPFSWFAAPDTQSEV